MAGGFGGLISRIVTAAQQAANNSNNSSPQQTRQNVANAIFPGLANNAAKNNTGSVLSRAANNVLPTPTSYVSASSWGSGQGSSSNGNSTPEPEKKPKEEKESEQPTAPGTQETNENNNNLYNIDMQSVQDLNTTDPNSLAMPTGMQMGQLTDEQQRQWAADRGSEFADLMFTLATLPIGGGIGAAGKLASQSGRFARAGKKAAETAAKSSKAAMEAGGKEAAKIAQAEANALPGAIDAAKYGINIAKESKIPTNSRTYYNALVNANKELATRTAKEELAEDIMPTLIPAGLIGTSLLGAGLLADTSGTGLQALNQPVEKGPGSKEAAKEAKDKEKPELTNEWQPKLGMTQMDEFYDWLENTEEGQAFNDKYEKAYDRANQGYSALRASQNRDAWADVMGYGDYGGISNWKNRYSMNGVDLSDEHAMDNMMNYLYGDNAVNLYNWANSGFDPNMRNVGLSDDAYAEMANWFASQNPEYLAMFNTPEAYTEGSNITPASIDENGNIIPGSFDANDFAYAQLVNRLDQLGFNDLTPEQLTSIAGAAGEGQKFGLTDEGKLGLLGDDGKYYLDENRVNRRGYDMNQIGQQLPLLTPYQDVLPDVNMIDTVLEAYNNPEKKGKKTEEKESKSK